MNRSPFSFNDEELLASSSGTTSPSHVTISDKLVDNPAQFFFDKDTIASSIVLQNQRFRVKLNEDDVERQLERRVKILSQFDLPDFKPKSEEEFEQWVDNSAAIITKNQVGVSLFQDA